MTSRYHLPILFGLLLSLTLAVGCKKEKIDNGDGGYPIELVAEQSGRNVLLSWTKINTSDFQNYVIVRSPEAIPDDLQPSVSTVATIDDYNTTAFDDISPLLNDYVYYKVYAKVGDRFLMSNTVKIATNVKLLDMIANRVVFDKENKLVYMFDPNKNKLFKYDYAQEKMLDTLNMLNVFDIRMAIGKHSGKNELYLALNGSSTIEVYDASNLSYQTTIFTNGTVYSIAAGNNGLLYIGTDSWNGSFAVYSRSAKQFLDSDQSFFSNGESSLTVLSDDGFKVAMVGFQDIGVFRVSQQGLILETRTTPSVGNFFGVVPKIAKSDDGQFFIPESVGNVFNDKLEPIGSLSGGGFTFFSDFAFSADNASIWAFNNSIGKLQEFSFDDFSEIRGFQLSYSVVQMAVDEDNLIVVGILTDVFGNSRTIVDKLNIL